MSTDRDDLANAVLAALSYANDDVTGAQEDAGEPVQTLQERLDIIRDILSDAYGEYESDFFTAGTRYGEGELNPDLYESPEDTETLVTDDTLEVPE